MNKVLVGETPLTPSGHNEDEIPERGYVMAAEQLRRTSTGLLTVVEPVDGIWVGSAVVGDRVIGVEVDGITVLVAVGAAVEGELVIGEVVVGILEGVLLGAVLVGLEEGSEVGA